METANKNAALVTEDEIGLRWRAVRRLWAAVAIAFFPLIFMVDTIISGFSPVLPGLAILVLIWAGVPYLHFEVWRPRKPDLEAARRHEMRSRYVLGVAVAWFLIWLVFA